MRYRLPGLLDVGLALALSALTVAAVASDDEHTSAPALVLAVLGVAPIALRQVAPMRTFLAITVALAAYGALGYGEWPSSGVGLVLALFTVAMHRPPRVSLLTLPVTTALVVVPKLAGEDVGWPDVLQGVLLCGCVWAVGDGARQWSARAQSAAAEGERRITEERLRIARELHDVVAHHMSVAALQTGVAAYVLDSEPATVRRSLDAAGAATREALREMARMLDALRTDEAAPASYGPQPGLAQLDELLDGVRGVGLVVSLERSGEPVDLDAGLELCAYRIVQESLTNVLKHAGTGATTTVRVERSARRLVVEVDDDGGRGTGRPPRALSAGRGIQGMRERAALYGGTLAAHGRTGGGFRVRLEVPL